VRYAHAGLSRQVYSLTTESRRGAQIRMSSLMHRLPGTKIR
jgi:hypothetical protein